MARLLRRGGLRRAILVLGAFVIGGVALIGVTAASAGPGVSTTTPFTFAGTNSCVVPAESFVGSGNLHLLISDNVSSSGSVQYHLEVSFSGLQAVTLITGQKYVVVDQENQTDTFDSDGMPAHETLEHTIQFIRSGESGTPLTTGDDFFEHFLAHITANANGTVTVNDLTADTRCR